MPELPEVERTRKFVSEFILNKKIIDCKACEDEIIFEKKSVSYIKSNLISKTVSSVGRKGKQFWFEFDTSPHISFHLGMTGRMLVKKANDSGCQNGAFYYRYPDLNETEQWPPKFWKLILVFEDNTMIAYTNTRRLGRVRFHRLKPEYEKPIKLLGYDPLTDMCDFNTFIKIMNNKKCALKACLLDQSIFAGIGNWISDEICYQSGIIPNILCCELDKKQLKVVYNNIITIIKYAVSVNADYHQFPSNWLFHYRWNKGKGSNRKRKGKTKGKGKGKNRNKSKNKNKNDSDSDSDDIDDEGGMNEDSFLRYITVGGRTTAVVDCMQSKLGYRKKFVNSKELGSNIDVIKRDIFGESNGNKNKSVKSIKSIKSKDKKTNKTKMKGNNKKNMSKSKLKKKIKANMKRNNNKENKNSKKNKDKKKDNKKENKKKKKKKGQSKGKNSHVSNSSIGKKRKAEKMKKKIRKTNVKTRNIAGKKSDSTLKSVPRRQSMRIALRNSLKLSKS